MLGANIALLLYSWIAGLLVDEFGANAPFTFIGVIDLLFALFVSLQICRTGSKN